MVGLVDLFESGYDDYYDSEFEMWMNLKGDDKKHELNEVLSDDEIKAGLLFEDILEETQTRTSDLNKKALDKRYELIKKHNRDEIMKGIKYFKESVRIDCNDYKYFIKNSDDSAWDLRELSIYTQQMIYSQDMLRDLIMMLTYVK